VEHHEVAIAHGRTAGLNMLGRDVPHEELPYFWSDLGDWATIEYVGVGGGEDVVRGSLDDRSFCAFFLDRAGVLRASVALNRPKECRRSLPLIRAGVAPDRAALADPEVDLRTLRP